MKLVSWNVNGIRAVMKKGFLEFLAEHQPDILGLQEIKVSDVARAQAEISFKDYQEYWNSAERPGYSGTATLVSRKLKVESYNAGLGEDNEGRVQTLGFADFYFVNCYFPNAKDDLSRIPFKRDFNAAILRHIKKLGKTGKPVVVAGDYNVAHEPIDLARPKENEGKKGYTKEERTDMSRFLEAGLIDTFRALHPTEQKYSWWSYYSFARDRGIGWRIDYVLASEVLQSKISDAFILDGIFGSDHCPVGIELKL